MAGGLIASTDKAPPRAVLIGNRASWSPRPDMAAARRIPPKGKRSLRRRKAVKSIGPSNAYTGACYFADE